MPPANCWTTPDPNQEFRMMPIDMRLIIEQKDIPRLLVECANSSMRDRRPRGADSGREAGAVRSGTATERPMRRPPPPSQTPSTPSPGMRSPGRGGFRNTGTCSEAHRFPTRQRKRKRDLQVRRRVQPIPSARPCPSRSKASYTFTIRPRLRRRAKASSRREGPPGPVRTPAAMPGATTPPAAGGGVQH